MYDNSLLAEFGNSPTRVKQWLGMVVERAKPMMLLLDMRVHLKVVGTIEHFNKNIRKISEWIEKISKTENKGKMGVISYFSAGNRSHFLHKITIPSSFILGSGNTKGMSYMGSACRTDGTQISITGKGKSILDTAKSFVHSLGYNIGIR